ncbi:MAG: hypothetical protein GX604_02575 [Actinobacteria bacterium]|nr:hypothetical protein [Actinomycetota bacterium]
MWVTVHLCSGLGLGAIWPGPPWIAIPAAVAKHALLDTMPHWDYTRHPRRVLWGALDVAAALMVTTAAARRARGRPRGATTLLAGVAAALPDLDVIDGLFPNRAIGNARRRLFPSHVEGYPHGDAGPLWGVSLQLFTAIVSLILFARRFPQQTSRT